MPEAHYEQGTTKHRETKTKGNKIKAVTYYMGNTNKGATSEGIKRVITI
jgi:hypothetical protein